MVFKYISFISSSISAIVKQNLRIFKLAHSNTLKKYSSFTSPSVGFNPDIISRLVDDSIIAHLEDYQKNVILSFDEMKIKSDLVCRR